MGRPRSMKLIVSMWARTVCALLGYQQVGFSQFWENYPNCSSRMVRVDDGTRFLVLEIQ